VQDRPDRGIVVSDEYVSCGHLFPLQVPPPGGASSPVNIGINTRNTVWRGCDSHSMIPPWSPTIFATNARPRPVPVGLVVTNGSNRWGIRSCGTPGPLSLTQNSSGSDTRVFDPGTARR